MIVQTPLTLRTVTGLDFSNQEAFLMEPVWTDPQDVFDPLSSMIRGASSFGKPSTKQGPTVVRSDGERTQEGGGRWSGRYEFLLISHAEQFEFFSNMRRWQGRVNPFWMPSWLSDFRVLRDIDPDQGNVILTRPNGFEHSYEDGRYGVMIQTQDRFIDVFQCTGYDARSGCLFVAGTLQNHIAVSNIARVSLVRRVRSDQRVFKWDYETDAAVRSIKFNVREVLSEGAYT